MKKGFFLIALMIPQFLWSQEVKTVNFVQEGEISKLIIETDKQVIANRFHVQEDKQIILDLQSVKISPKWLRGIDTSEFPGPAVYISGYKKPGSEKDIRFAVQLRDNVRSLLETKGNQIILNIENRFGVFSRDKIRNFENQKDSLEKTIQDSVALNVPKSSSVEDILENLTLSGPKKYIGKKISINVREMPLADLLAMVVDASGFNIILSDKVAADSAPITLTLTNVPWDQALDTIFSVAGLVAKKNANILFVMTKKEAESEREDLIKEELQKQEMVPLLTKVFLINYAKLEDLEKIVKDYLTPKRAALQRDVRTNSLIVRDTPESIERIKKIIEVLDTQTPQVLIESKIVEATEDYSKRIGLQRGISFGYDPVSQYGAPTGPGFAFSTAPNALNPGFMGATIAVYKRLLNLDFNLQLMESESKGRIISTPKVVTQNKVTATINSTEETSFRVQQPATGNQPALATFQKVQADLTLQVTPHVTNDGSVIMDLDLKKSAFGARPTADSPPDQTSRNVKTTVLVENGSTIVIGGLYQTSTIETISGIPFMKDLPLIGWLFRTPEAPNTKKNELIIFLTPRVMNQEAMGMTQRQATLNASEGASSSPL